jgi:hypothetical protein
MEDVGEPLIFVDSNMWLYYFGKDFPEHEFVKDSMKITLAKIFQSMNLSRTQ